LELALVPGENCWRIERSERLAILVDGEAYFGAVRNAMIAAEHRIAITAWDIHSRVELIRGPGGTDDDLPSALGDLLIALLERKPSLHVHILLWDYAPIYALEREPLFFGDGPWQGHSRLHFVKDSAHPLAASQHQKLVIVDDRLAFCGGFDLSKMRWDTPEHAAQEPRRRDPDGDPYPPYHDLAALVDGDAAAALMALFGERWARAGGAPLPAIARNPDQAADQHDPWPGGVEVMLQAQPVAIARTLPAYDGRPPVRESERLYLDIIGAARSLLYVENQYLTSRVIRDALCRSLEQARGPDIIILLPRQTGHWLEQHTMDVLRARLLSCLREADRHDRLRVYYPDACGGDDIMVHAKLMIADDQVLRLGSSNLSNRSMGLDSECDLCIVADQELQRRAITALRRRLMAMFLSLTPDDIAEAEEDALRRGEGMSAAIDALRRQRDAHDDAGGLRLVDLDGEADPEWDRQLPDERLIDPDRPLAPSLLADVVVGDPESASHVRRRLWISGAIVLLFLALAAAWRWTPLGAWLDPGTMAAAVQGLNEAPWGAPVALIGFVLASLIAVPVTLLILVTALVFGPLTGALVALLGSTLSAVAGYVIGRATGRRAVETLAGGSLERVSRRLASRGILTVITVRIVPVAPFAVINLIAGASHVRLRDFIIGTILGMTPGVIAMAVFAEGLLSLIGRADFRAIALVIVGLVALVGLAWLGRRLLLRGGA
jgi:phosphatidylserine/phosphatidylglycerophosphate/cardiolipin synthase-like enzyme/uncharacterized membrane protein YdjX (TVP38/TMEM64 family)